MSVCVVCEGVGIRWVSTRGVADSFKTTSKGVRAEECLCGGAQRRHAGPKQPVFPREHRAPVSNAAAPSERECNIRRGRERTQHPARERENATSGEGEGKMQHPARERENATSGEGEGKMQHPARENSAR